MKKRYIFIIAICAILSLFVSCDGGVDEMLFKGDDTQVTLGQLLTLKVSGYSSMLMRTGTGTATLHSTYVKIKTMTGKTALPLMVMW